MLKRLAGKFFYCFLDGYNGYNQIVINPEDQLHLHVYLVHMHIGECPLISVMHPQRFKDA